MKKRPTGSSLKADTSGSSVVKGQLNADGGPAVCGRSTQTVSTNIADLYFVQLYSRGSCLTSKKSKKLKRSKLVPVNWSKLDALLRSEEIELTSDSSCFEYLFDRWIRYLSESFNLLLYGFGSKYNVVKLFADTCLAGFTCIHVCGYKSDVSLSMILEAIGEGLGVKFDKDSGSTRKSSDQMLDHLKHVLTTTDRDIFLLILNIDAVNLRSNVVQEAFSSLAACSKNLHIVASIDHVNAAALWDQSQMARLNWLLFHVPTKNSYSKELLGSESTILQSGGGIGSRTHTVASLSSLWAALTKNARQIFVLLAQHHFKLYRQKNYCGMDFWDLFQECKNEFYVSSEASLRSQLVEFKDHKLVESRRAVDGSELLNITVNAETLSEFLRSKGHHLEVASASTETSDDEGSNNESLSSSETESDDT